MEVLYTQLCSQQPVHSHLFRSVLFSFTKLLFWKQKCNARSLLHHNLNKIVSPVLKRMNYNFPPVFICLFVWQEVIKRYLEISRNRTVILARQESFKKITAWRQKERNRKYFISTKCNKMNNKKRKNWDFYEIKVENKMRNFNHRLKKCFNICTDEGFSEARPLIYLSQHVFRSQ